MKHFMGILASVFALATPSTSNAQCAVEQDELGAGNAEQGDRLGEAIALSSDLAAIGAPRTRDTIGNQVGSVYVFGRSGTDWNEQAELEPSDPNAAMQFGSSVTLAGRTVIAGAPNALNGTEVPGAAYVYVESSGQWSQQAKLLASDGLTKDAFGSSVALFGDTAVIGARRKSDLGGRAGGAYVFERTGTQWSETAILLASDGSNLDEFGFSATMDGDTIVLGAPTQNDAGAAYVFVRAGTDWVEQGKLVPSDIAAGDGFGVSVALQGDTLVVGANRDDDEGENSGSAYVFERSGTLWSLGAKLTATDGTAGDLFGISAAIDEAEDAVVVGAMLAGESGENIGRAYVFRRDGAGWREFAPLTPSDATENDHFGSATAIRGDYVLVGALADSSNASFAGSTYVFANPEFGDPFAYCTAKTNSLGCVPQIEFSGCSSASEIAGFRISVTEVRNHRIGYLVYGLGTPAAIPYQGGLLCFSPPVYRAVPRDSGGHLPPIQDCSGSFELDMNAFAMGLVGGHPRAELLVPGTRVQAQWWSRDIGDPFGSSLTAAVDYFVQP